jgi:hypothetical protein
MSFSKIPPCRLRPSPLLTCAKGNLLSMQQQDAAPAQDCNVMSLKTQKRITMQTNILVCVVLIYISFLSVLNLYQVLGQEEEEASARPSPFRPEFKRLRSASARPTLFFRCYSLLNWRRWCRRRGTGEKDGDGARPMLFFLELKIMWKGKNECEHARSLYEQLFFGYIPCKQEDWDCFLYLLLSKY